MNTILVLTEQELRQQVSLDMEAIDCVEQALGALAKKDVVMPPILHLAIKQYNGEVDVKTAYVPGIDSFAIKISPGFFDDPPVSVAFSSLSPQTVHYERNST